ncbi:DUF4383 domain-containing protein [Candidatus Gracilibacteria bacterium]|nr:DUF4383 domain-containing protein [Candidatus Gracilibacteria bacterium]
MGATTKTWAAITGAVFLILGVLGFLDNSLISARGYFLTDGALSLVHALTGVVSLAFAYGATEHGANLGLKVIGGLYVVVALVGFVVVSPTNTQLLGMQVNMPSNWLHLILGAGVLAVAWATSESHHRHFAAHA